MEYMESAKGLLGYHFPHSAKKILNYRITVDNFSPG